MDNTGAILPAALDQYRIAEQDRKTADASLGQQQFFDLMVTQLQNQDPFKPMESGDFLGQIAQFSTVNGITELQASFASLASSLQSSQALQASTMVGREVVIPRTTVRLEEGKGAQVAASLPAAATSVRLTVTDASGQVVRQALLGPQEAGTVRFDWNGLRDNGALALPGTYGVKLEATIGGQSQALTSAVRARVDSVSLSRNGLPPTLNVAGFGAVDMSEVIEIL